MVPGYTRFAPEASVYNASTNGVGSSYISIYQITKTESSTLVWLRNFSSSKAIIRIDVACMYINDQLLTKI